METTAAATTATAAAGQGFGVNGMFLVVIVFLAVFMFLSSRSQKKREDEQRKAISALEKGDKVILMGGIVGTVAGFNDQIIEVKVAENTKFSVLPNGIVSILKNQPIENGAKSK